MSGGNTLCIHVEDLDLEIKRKISDHVFFAINRMELGSNISDSELNNAFDSGIRNEVNAFVREYYEFLGDISIEISNQDLREIYKTYE